MELVQRGSSKNARSAILKKIRSKGHSRKGWMATRRAANPYLQPTCLLPVLCVVFVGLWVCGLHVGIVLVAHDPPCLVSGRGGSTTGPSNASLEGRLGFSDRFLEVIGLMTSVVAARLCTSDHNLWSGSRHSRWAHGPSCSARCWSCWLGDAWAQGEEEDEELCKGKRRRKSYRKITTDATDC